MTVSVKEQKGFTLLEMAIVLAIFGLLASGGLLAASAALEKAAIAKTKENLDKIENALTVFVIQRGYLPCPHNKDNPAEVDPSDPVLSCVNTPDPTSPVTYGMVPYLELGLQKKEVMDGWNRYISYSVDSAFTPDAVLPSDGVSRPMACGIATYTEINGLPSLAVMDANGNAPADLGAYVLVAHGKNGFGAYLSETVNFGGRPPAGAGDEELENSVSGGTLTDYYYEPINNIGFDDVLRSRSPARILYDGGCPSA